MMKRILILNEVHPVKYFTEENALNIENQRFTF